jgi:hypothetical protein
MVLFLHTYIRAAHSGAKPHHAKKAAAADVIVHNHSEGNIRNAGT